jgi:F-type H+-transporting ATPase subunit alpha
MKQVAGSLKLELAQYRELAAFTQFGSDLDKATIAQLERGKRLSELLKQDEGQPIKVEEQIIVIFAGTNGFLDSVALDSVHEYETELIKFILTNYPDILREIKDKKKLSDELIASMKSALTEFGKEFTENTESSKE